MDEWTRLACAARGGADRQALDAFVRVTHRDVWRLCAHLGDADRADDLAQETFLRVIGSLPGFRGESSVRAWLFSIVRHVVADDIAARRRRRGREWPPGLDDRPDALANATSPDHQGSVALEHLLGCLDPDRRAAFVLTQVLGYSYAEAAEACDVPVGTVRSRVARARLVLTAMLGDPERPALAVPA